MRKIWSIFSVLALLFVVTFVTLPQKAAAEFAERPVAFAVLDHDGDVNASVYRAWRQAVKWAYYFPYYKIIEGEEQNRLLVDAVRAGKKLDKATLAELAEQSGADVFVAVRVYELDESFVQSMGLRRMDETYVRVVAAADLAVYKKDGEKFLQKRLRERELREPGNYEHPDETVKWELSKLVNKMENRPIIGE